MTDAAKMPLATVGALIVGPSKRVLLIKTHKWKGSWGVPGGKIHYGEGMAEALKREVREETGLELTEHYFALLQEAVRSSEFHRDAHFLLINFIAFSDSEAVTLNDEAQAYSWVTPEEGLAMALNTPTRKLLAHYLHEPLEPLACRAHW